MDRRVQRPGQGVRRLRRPGRRRRTDRSRHLAVGRPGDDHADGPTRRGLRLLPRAADPGVLGGCTADRGRQRWGRGRVGCDPRAVCTDEPRQPGAVGQEGPAHADRRALAGPVRRCDHDRSPMDARSPAVPGAGGPRLHGGGPDPPIPHVAPAAGPKRVVAARATAGPRTHRPAGVGPASRCAPAAGPRVRLGVAGRDAGRRARDRVGCGGSDRPHGGRLAVRVGVRGRVPPLRHPLPGAGRFCAAEVAGHGRPRVGRSDDPRPRCGAPRGVLRSPGCSPGAVSRSGSSSWWSRPCSGSGR